MSDRPFAVVVLAMSLDGKIADAHRSPARFGSHHDKQHLEQQIAQADAVLFGANTLRAYGTTLRITQPELLHQRQQQEKPLQPVHIVCSRSGNFDPKLRFFHQPVPRWLITTTDTANQWCDTPQFDRVLGVEALANQLNWTIAFRQLVALGIKRLTVLGGGELIASLLAADLIDELWLTICPLLLGGRTAPTPVAGWGFSEALAPRLELLTQRSIGHEIFLHYKVCRPS